MKRLVLLLSVSAVLLWEMGEAGATLALDFTGGVPALAGTSPFGGLTVGWEFQVVSPIMVHDPRILGRRAHRANKYTRRRSLDGGRLDVACLNDDNER